MKKAFVVAAVLAATSAQATSGLDFGDLNYFIKQNQFNLTSNISIVDQEVKPEGAAARTQTRGYVLDNRFGFGVMDNLNVFVGLDFAFLYEIQQKGSRDSDNGGLSNPYFGANYRLLNQKDSAFNLDFGVVGRVQIMDAEVGTQGKDGTFNKGYNSLEVNSSIGHKWNEANEWRLTAAVIQNFSGDYDAKDSSGSTKVNTDASTDFGLTAAYQYRPVQEFMMNVSLQALRVGEAKGDASSVDIKNDSHLDMNFRFSAKYLITETFIARFNYGISRLGEYDQDVGGTTTEQKERHANFYGGGIDWLF